MATPGETPQPEKPAEPPADAGRKPAETIAAKEIADAGPKTSLLQLGENYEGAVARQDSEGREKGKPVLAKLEQTIRKNVEWGQKEGLKVA